MAAFCLTLPGKILHLTPLLNAKKFRGKGKKEDVVRAFYKLEEEGLGTTLILTGSKGTTQVSSYGYGMSHLSELMWFLAI